MNDSWAPLVASLQTNVSFETAPVVRRGSDAAVHIFQAYFDSLLGPQFRYEISNSTAYCGAQGDAVVEADRSAGAGPTGLVLHSADVDSGSQTEDAAGINRDDALKVGIYALVAATGMPRPGMTRRPRLLIKLLHYTPYRAHMTFAVHDIHLWSGAHQTVIYAATDVPTRPRPWPPPTGTGGLVATATNRWPFPTRGSLKLGLQSRKVRGSGSALIWVCLAATVPLSVASRRGVLGIGVPVDRSS